LARQEYVVPVDRPGWVAVVQDEVPWPVARPREDPIEAVLDEEPLKLVGRQPQVQVGVLTRLLLQQRAPVVDRGPAVGRLCLPRLRMGTIG
jgi:hypothetical protein